MISCIHVGSNLRLASMFGAAPRCWRCPECSQCLVTRDHPQVNPKHRSCATYFRSRCIKSLLWHVEVFMVMGDAREISEQRAGAAFGDFYRRGLDGQVRGPRCCSDRTSWPTTSSTTPSSPCTAVGIRSSTRAVPQRLGAEWLSRGAPQTIAIRAADTPTDRSWAHIVSWRAPR